MREKKHDYMKYDRIFQMTLSVHQKIKELYNYFI